MASTTNGNGNLVDEFEEAFQSCLAVLTKEEALATMEKEEIKVEADTNILRFIDLARQMEAFFLQKRFLLSALKPELIVKEDINDLRQELTRKEEMIKRHHEKIAIWQNLLADVQGWQGGNSSGGPKPGSAGMGGAAPPTPPQPPPPAMQAMQNNMAAMQQHQLHMQQHMQQQMQQVPNMVGGGMNQMMMGGGGMGLHGPLAYLEKTTSNIGVGGAGGGAGEGGGRR